jgi:pSer/pThr/pTyr-binding forkhead associated (FHA) protein
MEVKLQVAQGKEKGREIPLPPTVFLIGRGSQCHLRPHCQLVSKLHCAIACWAGKVVVRDLRSANGTFVNDERITGEARIRNGDTLRVGSLIFTFRVKVEVGPDMPVQVVHRGDVRWLLESAAGDPTLKTSDTGEFDIRGLAQGTVNTAATANVETLSAGQYLRDYLQKPLTS